MSRREFKFISKFEHNDIFTASELMVRNNLDWNVSLNDVYASGSFDPIKINNRFATVKTDRNGNETVLSVVGSRYRVFQNSDIFSTLDAVVGSGDARYGSAGELDGGKVVWSVLSLPDNVNVGKDEHSAYVVARTSHDGSTPFQLVPMINRLACTNQINALMLSQKQKGLYYSVRHTQNSVIDPQDIKAVFGIIREDVKRYTNISNWLVGESFSAEEFTQFTKVVYPMSSIIEHTPVNMLSPGQLRTRTSVLRNRFNALNIFNGLEGNTLNGIENTKFAAFQSIVEVSDHYSKNASKQEDKILLGKDTNIKSRALSLLTGV